MKSLGDDSDEHRSIIHVLPHIRNVGNGIVNATVDLALEQVKRGVSVTVVSSGGDFAEHLEREGVKVVVESGLLTLGVEAPRRVVRFRRLIRECGVAIVHAHTPKCVVFARAGIVGLNVRLVATCHNLFDRARYCLVLADALIAVSHSNAIAIRRWAWPRPVHVVPNGTVGNSRPQNFSSSDLKLTSPSVLFVGGMNARKGVADLLRCVTPVRDSTGLDVMFYLCGGGPERAEFEELARSLAILDVVHFLGMRDDAVRLMQECDVFVLPSLSEGLPLVLIEAREAGCAIVATEVDGNVEALEGGRVGILVPARSPEQLAVAISTLILDDDIRSQLGVSASSGLDRYSITRVCSDVDEVYRSLT